MNWTRNESGAEVFVVYADLFMLLFIMAVLMMGQNTTSQNEQTSRQTNEQSPSEDPVLSLYVDDRGRTYQDPSRRQLVTRDGIGQLLQAMPTKRIILYTPGELSMTLYGEVQTALAKAGATEIAYLIEETRHE